MDNAGVHPEQQILAALRQDPGGLELRLLGAPGLDALGGVINPGSRKAFALLAWLALNGAATRPRLATLLWPDLDSASARRNLRRELHRLRMAGAGHALQVQADGLALAPGVAVDVHAFEAAAAQGHTQRALALYRGALLEGFDLSDGGDFEPWAQVERERLARLHREALRTLAERQESEADWPAALATRLRLIEHDTLHEQHYRDAMRLHALLGEPESALRLFDRCRRRLQRELGLAPMPQTVALARAIRERGEAPVQAPGQSPPAPAVTAAGDAAEPPCVGRAALLQELDAETRELWLLGEAGIGKSRLVREWTRRHGRPTMVRAQMGDAQQPYATLLRALQQRWQAPVAATWPGWMSEELARLLPACFPDLAAPSGTVDLGRQHAALNAAWLGLQAPGDGPTVLEDWHLADAATRALWPPGRMPGPGRVVVTLRPAEAEAALRTALQQAQHEGLCKLREVPPLDADAVAALSQALAGMTLPPRSAVRWQRATGGNPFFIVELLRRATPAQLSAESAPQSPPSVQEAVLARLLRLDEATRRMLELACLSDEPFDADELDDGSALSPAERVAAIEQALAHQVLQRYPDGGLAFRHHLLAEALAGQLSPERRRLLHASLAAALERRGAPPGRMVRHLEAAGRPAEALRWTLLAVQAAERLGALGVALAGLDRALALAPAEQAAALHLRRVQLLQRSAAPLEADAALDAAEHAALRAGMGEQVRQVLLARADHFVCSSRLDAGAALVQGLLDDGLADIRERAEALEILADVQLRRGNTAAAQAALRQALKDLPPGPSPTRARLLLAVGRCAMYLGALDEAVASLERAVRAYAALGLAEGMARATFMQGAAEMNGGRLDVARRLLERARVLGAGAGSVPVQRGAILNLVKILTQTGEVAQARVMVAQGEALSPVYESAVAEAAFVQARYYCELLGGDLVSARALIPRVLATGDACGEPYWAAGARQLVVDLLLLDGDLAQARCLLDEAAARCAQSDGLMRPVVEVKRAWAELLAGDPAAALARLALLGALDNLQPAEARDTGRHVGAGAALSLGDASQALALLLDPATAVTEEARALQWAMRVQAEGRLGGVQPATAQAIAALLAAPTTPPLEAGVLRRALAAVCEQPVPLVLC